MRHAWTIAAKDLRRRLRDRSAILVALILPFGLAWIFSLTLGDVESAGFDANYAVVDVDGGQLSSDFGSVLQSLDFVTIQDVGQRDCGGRLAEGRRHRRGVHLPRGLHAAGASGPGRRDPRDRVARLEHRLAGGRLARSLVQPRT